MDFPECAICNQHTIETVTFRCDATPSHVMCATCAREMIRVELDKRNFDGCAAEPLFTFGLTCPLCRGYVVDSPFKLFPTVLYALEKNVRRKCDKCDFETTDAEVAVRHTIFECPTNVFECRLCEAQVPWGYLKPDSLISSHILSNACTGVLCFGGSYAGKCVYAGKYADALKHNASHKVRRYIKRKFKKMLAAADCDALANLLDVDWKEVLARNPSVSAEARLHMLSKMTDAEVANLADEENKRDPKDIVIAMHDDNTEVDDEDEEYSDSDDE